MVPAPHWVSTTLQIFQGLLTPVIAGTAVYIALQQYKVSKQKFEFDLYERRLRVYEQIVAILSLVIRDFKPEFADLQKFRAATAEADFLFKPEIPAYLNEIVKRAWSLRSAKNEFRDLFQVAPPGYDHNKVVSEMHEQEIWFTKQLSEGEATRMFKKYLSVNER